MANENEGQALREYGNRKKRYKKRRRAIIIAVILILAVLGSIYLIRLYNRNYNSYSVIKKVDVSATSAVGYLNYGTSIVKYSKDGAVAVDKSGRLLWNGSYEMSTPIVDTCDNYVAIADKDGKSIHIFNQKGEVGNGIQTRYNIQKVEVARQGVVAALMETENGNDIKLYDATDGTELWDKTTSVNTEGYPMDFSMSDDGKKLVFSYLSYADGKLVDNISFYNLGEVGQNFTDGIVGGWAFAEGIIVPRVAFVNNDTACVFKDNGFLIYSVAEKPKLVHEEDFEGKIQSILYNNKYVGVVLQKDGTSTKQLLLYDLSGKKVLDKTLDFDYEKISLSDNEIVMYDNMSCLIMKLNGKVKFKYTFDSNIEAIYSINNIDQYYLANDSKLYEIQLKE
ncbi:MAG TPA: DUF5711 family protein [Mobilitalea sp.]|nr:DUF5711 family protein [Mobilitalea sp.]